MKALISGASGQDGSYLSEFLHKKGYDVFGMERRVAMEDQTKRHRIKLPATIIPCDVTNYASVFHAMSKLMPDEIYHLAAQSDVGYSFGSPFETMDTNVKGTMNMLEASRLLVPNAKFYFAASSEMFGSQPGPQNEDTPFHPRSPYGVSKVTGFHLTQNYREAYNMFACSGILFNHESPRRGKEFVTRKITSTLSRIKQGLENKLVLGNLDSKRDWGFSGDYVEAMWMMLQQDKPEDFVIGTGETHTIRDFLKEAFTRKGLKWEDYVVQDARFMRPAEVNVLLADASKARTKLGWEPKTKFKDLVKMMVLDEDLSRFDG
jgi:GDPmannose 4,6-dehydratase